MTLFFRVVLSSRGCIRARKDEFICTSTCSRFIYVSYKAASGLNTRMTSRGGRWVQHTSRPPLSSEAWLPRLQNENEDARMGKNMYR